MKEQQIVSIEMSLIDPNPDNNTIFNMDDIEYLAEGIREDGFIGSIDVLEKPNGRFEIISGHRRYEAMKLLKESKIPCIINKNINTIDKAKRLLGSNLRSRNLKPLDYARSIKYYKENVLAPKGIKGEEKERECVKYFNMSLSSLKRYESLLKLIPNLQQVANEKEFPFSTLSAASTLNDAQQNELYINIRNYINSSELNSISGLRIAQMLDSIKTRDNYKKQPNGKGIKKTKDDTPVVFYKSEDVNIAEEEIVIENKNLGREDNILIQEETADSYEDVEDSQQYLDTMLSIYMKQFYDILHSNYAISNKEEVINNLKKIKEGIEELEKNIK